MGNTTQKLALSMRYFTNLASLGLQSLIIPLQEELPPGFNHDVVRALFEKAGAVAYVSLPRFQTETKAFKGFAFVEYASEEAAQHAVQFFAQERKKGPAPRVVMKYVTYTLILLCSIHSILKGRNGNA